MIRYNDVKDKIGDYSSRGEWGKILDLIGCKNSINDDIDNELKSALYFYYSNLIMNVAGTIGKSSNSETDTDRAAIFIKYYDLFNQAKKLTFSIHQNESDYLITLRSIAYFYKTIYESKLWTSKIFRSYPKELQDKLISDGYTLEFFRDNALYFYYLCLNRDPDDIKTNYRYAHLFRELIQNALNGGKRDENGKLLPINYTIGLVKHLSPQGLRQYANYLNISKIPVMHIGFKDRRDFDYYSKAVNLWEGCTNQKEKDRTKAEYLKALYGTCRYYIDCMDSLNKAAAGLNYDVLYSCSKELAGYIKYDNQRKIVQASDIVNARLKIILETIGFPTNIAGLTYDKHIIYDKLPVESNYYYYTLAKYYIAYGTNQFEDKKYLVAALKASFFSCVADYNLRTIKERNKSVSLWPYAQFEDILRNLRLENEMFIFENKYLRRISRSQKNFILTTKKIFKLTCQEKYVEAKEIALDFLENNRTSPANKAIIKKMIERADAFINNPNLIQENRDIKAQQILAKNTLTAIGFYRK